MDDYSLVPVEHQPDFAGVSLVPVEHNPFSADAEIPQAQAQPGQTQPEHPLPPPATGIALPGVGTQAAESGESWDPEAEHDGAYGPDQSTRPSAAPSASPDSAAFKPFGELKPATYTPAQQIGNFAADALMGLGMKPYFANDLTSRVGDLLGWTPLGEAGSALDLIDAKRRDDLPGVLAAAAGMIPGGKGAARSAVRKATDGHHPWSMYLGGPVKQELVPLPRSLHVEFHRKMDGVVPKQKGKAYYENLSPEMKQEAFQKFAERTKEFDAEHGTELYNALIKNGFPEP